MENRRELVRAVREYARAHYEKSGWDVVVESYDDADIISAMGPAETPEQAIRAVGEEIGMHDKYRSDIEATAF
jgi:uncharacterized protein (UPF0264 family)